MAHPHQKEIALSPAGDFTTLLLHGITPFLVARVRRQ
jgi:hypothetical protein